MDNNFENLKKIYGDKKFLSNNVVQDLINIEFSNFKLVSIEQFMEEIEYEIQKYRNSKRVDKNIRIDALNNKIELIKNQSSNQGYDNPMIMYDCVNLGSAYIVGILNEKVDIKPLDGFFGCAIMNADNEKLTFIKNDYKSITEIDIDNQSINIRYYDDSIYNKITNLKGNYLLKRNVFDIDSSIIPTNQLLIRDNKYQLLINDKLESEDNIDMDNITYAECTDLLNSLVNKRKK